MWPYNDEEAGWLAPLPAQADRAPSAPRTRPAVNDNNPAQRTAPVPPRHTDPET
jgi:hypothetical protein